MSDARSRADDAAGVARAATVSAAPRGDRPTKTWGRVIVAVVALLVAYDLFEAIANLVGVMTQVNAYNEFATENGLNAAAIPWVVLVLNMLVSPIAFIAALRIGRGRPFGQRVLVLLAGLAAAAAVTLSLIAFA